MSTTTQTHLMTAEELMNLPDDSHRHELIKGELLTMPPPDFSHGRTSANLMVVLGQFVKVNRLGDMCGETGYILERDPDTVCKATGERTLFHETDELVDDTVPGFRVKVSETFA